MVIALAKELDASNNDAQRRGGKEHQKTCDGEALGSRRDLLGDQSSNNHEESRICADIQGEGENVICGGIFSFHWKPPCMISRTMRTASQEVTPMRRRRM